MVAIDGGPVVAHAQAFADEINRRWGFTHILTYPGHQPDQQHALDNFQTRDIMLQLAQWCTRDDVIDKYGIDYVIFDVYQASNAGEIYNREISRSWRTMEDRGSPTQNHHDHVHVSFNKTAQGPFGPIPEPFREDEMSAVRIPVPDANSHRAPETTKGHEAGTPCEEGKLGLFGKGRIRVSSDQYPVNGSDCRITIGSPGKYRIEEIWIGGEPATYDYDESKGDRNVCVTVYGVGAGSVTITAAREG